MIDKIFDNLLEFSFSISFLIFVIGVFFWMVGNPFAYIFNFIQSLIPSAIKEMRGGAGKAGVINIIIVAFTFILSLLFLIKPGFSSFWGLENTTNSIISFLVFIVCIIVFIISLRTVVEYDKMIGLFREPKE